MQPSSDQVWVFVEQRNGKPADVSFELLSKGQKLSQAMGGPLKSVIIGHDLAGLAAETFRYGATEALVVDHPDLKQYRTLPYGRILTGLVREHKPRIVLFGATVIGRDLAPRVASATRSGLTADCTELKIADISYLRKEYKKILLQIRPAFGGNIVATIITPDNPIQMATVREGVMEMLPLENHHQGVVTSIPYSPNGVDGLVQIIEQHHEENKINLKAASVIVAGGYGMATRENFRLIHDLAHTVGAEVAGSRAAVDAGFVPPERQVGQTGVTVRPKLYIAVGISGAIQHRAGMQESKKIIAINSDPDAPIFSISHYGIVGDALEVIPRFIEVYKNRLR